MARPRNNIMRLSRDIRLRICQLLDDGATYDECRDDEDVAAEVAEKGLVLHNTTFLAYRGGREFAGYRESAMKWKSEMEERVMASALVRSGHGPESLADIAEYELLKICVNKLRDGEELDNKELSSISRAVAGYQRNRITAEKEDSKREYAEKEAEYQARIAELSAKIAELTNNTNNTDGLSEETLSKIEEAAGLL